MTRAQRRNVFVRHGPPNARAPTTSWLQDTRGQHKGAPPSSVAKRRTHASSGTHPAAAAPSDGAPALHRRPRRPLSTGADAHTAAPTPPNLHNVSTAPRAWQRGHDKGLRLGGALREEGLELADAVLCVCEEVRLHLRGNTSGEWVSGGEWVSATGGGRESIVARGLSMERSRARRGWAGVAPAAASSPSSAAQTAPARTTHDKRKDQRRRSGGVQAACALSPGRRRGARGIVRVRTFFAVEISASISSVLRLRASSIFGSAMRAV